MTTEPKPICPRCSESSAVQAHKQLDGSTAYWCDRLGCAGWINTLTPRKGHFTADFEGAPVAKGGTAPPAAKPKRSRKLRAPPTASEPTPEPQPGPLICRPPTEAEAEQMAAEHPQYVRPVAETVRVVRSPDAATLVEQHRAAKREHPDKLLLFKVGSFYETYAEDAATVATVLGASGAEIRAVGSIQAAFIDVVDLEKSLTKLLKAGHKVAVLEQVAAPPTRPPLRSNIESIMGPEGSPESRAAAVERAEALAAKVEPQLKNGQPTPDPLSVPCPKCRAGAGEKCKNCKGQNKQTCPTRGKPSRLSKEGERLAAKPLFGKEWEQQAADSSEGTGATPEGSAEEGESPAPAPDADDEEGWYTCTCKCGCRIPVPPDGPSYCPECLGSPKKHKPPEGQPDDGIPRCRVCGCTEDDCSLCVARTGQPCRWADAAQDLCTACTPIVNAELDLVPGIPAGTLKALQKAGLQHVGQVLGKDPKEFVGKCLATTRQARDVLAAVGAWVKDQLSRDEEGDPITTAPPVGSPCACPCGCQRPTEAVTSLPGGTDLCPYCIGAPVNHKRPAPKANGHAAPAGTSPVTRATRLNTLLDTDSTVLALAALLQHNVGTVGQLLDLAARQEVAGRHRGKARELPTRLYQALRGLKVDAGEAKKVCAILGDVLEGLAAEPAGSGV